MTLAEAIRFAFGSTQEYRQLCASSMHLYGQDGPGFARRRVDENETRDKAMRYG